MRGGKAATVFKGTNALFVNEATLVSIMQHWMDDLVTTGYPDEPYVTVTGVTAIASTPPTFSIQLKQVEEPPTQPEAATP